MASLEGMGPIPLTVHMPFDTEVTRLGIHLDTDCM